MAVRREAIELLGGARVPTALERRVRAYSVFAEQLLDSGEPEAIRLGGAILQFFENGGDLARLLGLTTERGSHITIRAIYRRIKSSSSAMKAAPRTRGNTIRSTNHPRVET